MGQRVDQSFEIVIRGQEFFVSMTEFDLIRDLATYSIKDERFVFEMQDKTRITTSKIPKQLLPLITSRREIVFAKINMGGVRGDAICVKRAKNPAPTH